MRVWVVSLSNHELSPAVLTFREHYTGIRSLIELNSLRHPDPFSALPPASFKRKLYQDIFRGEPAISRFVWHVTPNHKSSHPIATEKGSVLHLNFRETSTCSWLAHLVSGLIYTPKRPVRARFHCASVRLTLLKLGI